jgi:hypothetical protein
MVLSSCFKLSLRLFGVLFDCSSLYCRHHQLHYFQNYCEYHNKHEYYTALATTTTFATTSSTTATFIAGATVFVIISLVRLIAISIMLINRLWSWTLRHWLLSARFATRGIREMPLSTSS